jgi:hypothetical protein
VVLLGKVLRESLAAKAGADLDGPAAQDPEMGPGIIQRHQRQVQRISGPYREPGIAEPLDGCFELGASRFRPGTLLAPDVIWETSAGAAGRLPGVAGREPSSMVPVLIRSQDNLRSFYSTAGILPPSRTLGWSIPTMIPSGM